MAAVGSVAHVLSTTLHTHMVEAGASRPPNSGAAVDREGSQWSAFACPGKEAVARPHLASVEGLVSFAFYTYLHRLG